MRPRLRLHAKTLKTVPLKTHNFLTSLHVTWGALQFTILTVRPMQIGLSRIKSSVSLNRQHFLYYEGKILASRTAQAHVGRHVAE